MGNDPLFRSHRYTVSWKQPEKRTFIRSYPGAGMALHDPCNRFRHAEAPAEICTCLCMAYGMGNTSSDVMEHGTGFNKPVIDKRAIRGKIHGNGCYCPAVCNHAAVASLFPEEGFAGFTLIRHGRLIPGSL